MKSKIAASAGANQFEAWPVPSAVLAPLKYRVKGSEKPAVYSDTTDADAPERSGAFWQTVSIADGRPVVDRLSLDGEGFELRPHDTAVSSFYDDAEVRTVYYPEVEQLVKAATGASRVVIFDHTVRIEDEAQRDERAFRGPARVVHNDYTERSGRQRVHDLLDADDAETFLQHRFAIVNVWRSIGAFFTLNRDISEGIRKKMARKSVAEMSVAPFALLFFVFAAVSAYQVASDVTDKIEERSERISIVLDGFPS